MGLEEIEIAGRQETIQTTADRPEYWEQFWRPEETCTHSKSNERPSANTGMKNLHNSK